MVATKVMCQIPKCNDCDAEREVTVIDHGLPHANKLVITAQCPKCETEYVYNFHRKPGHNQ